MIPAELPENESERLQLLDEHRLFITGREPEFDRIARNAADHFGVSAALLSLVLPTEQAFLGACGFDLPGTTRDVSFCAHAILGDPVMVVRDATKDPRFARNPLVTGPPHIRFYAGAPLLFGPRLSVGTVCLVDPRPRDFPEDRRRVLSSISETVVDMIRLRLGARMAVDARERAEERERSLAEQRQLLSTTLENIEHGVIVIGPDRRLEVYNETFFRMLQLPSSLKQIGVPANQLLRAIVELGCYENRPKAAVLAEHLSRIRANESIRRTIQVSDDTLVEYTYSAMPDGRFLMVTTDISARHRIERMKSQFVSTVSHELRTPITSIIGSLGLLGGGIGGTLDERGKRLLEIARQNCDRLGRLVNDLLDTSKIEAGHLALAPTHVALAPFLRQAIEKNAPYAQRFGVEVSLSAKADLTVMADPHRLEQVVTNLLSNAVKFSPKGGKVDVSLAQRDGSARISVADDGPGIPTEFQGRIFQKFAQADATPSRANQGTGLGLSISRHLVEMMGGRIWFETEPGHGTVFHVELEGVMQGDAVGGASR